MAISIPHRAEAIRSPSGRALAFVVGASTFLVVAVVFALSRSSLFALRHLDVTGGNHRSNAEIRELAEVALGTNVVWLDTSDVAERLAHDPWIARASVTRALPWSLSISVVERTPVAVIDGGRQAGGTLVAADGTRLGPATADSPLPRISLPPSAPATVGLPGEDGAIRAIAAMAPAVRHRVREVQVLVGGTLTLRLAGGATVDLGSAVDLEAKARALRRVMLWERSTGSDLADLSLVAPTAPAARLQA